MVTVRRGNTRLTASKSPLQASYGMDGSNMRVGHLNLKNIDRRLNRYSETATC